jgi:DNA-binding NarL/FixJ family response regulator
MKKKEKPRTKTKKKTRILIVDDHPVIREGLTQIINRETDLLVCAEAGTIGEAVKAVKKQKIDLALVDMLLNNTTGIQVIKRIKSLCPGIVSLVFSMSDNSQYVKQAIVAGARGYITKDEISEEIVGAIRQIVKGQIYMSGRLCKSFSKEELNSLLAGKVQGCCD